jgi:protein TonB
LTQPAAVPDTPLIDRIRSGLGRRTLGLGLALLIEVLLLLMLLSLGPGEPAGEEERRITVVNFNAEKAAQMAPATDSPESAQRAEQPAPQRAPADERRPSEVPQPQPPAPAQPSPSQPPPATPPLSRPNPVPTPPAPAPSAAAPPRTGRPAGARPVYGPPNPGGGGGSLDTERVGTAPNGEPLYAAAWHTRPRPDQLGGYLATASGPGWGVIACRTAPGFRVEDCVGIDEYPAGSQITRAVLAAAWEFKVRPPRIGGRSLVGSWVEIRIDYTIVRR